MKTETKHTLNRLYATREHVQELEKEEDNYICGVEGDTQEQAEANAVRIVACWNACLDMSDPEKELAQLKADKAELVEALKHLLCYTESDSDDEQELLDHFNAQSLIAKHSKV